jgi:hypothetical protein
MRRFFFGVAALVIGLAVGTAEAGHPPAGGKHGGSHGVMHAHKYVVGSYHKSAKFKVKGSFFWTRRCWDARYLCFLYFCPDDGVYYYWCVPDECYYPVSYCPYGVYAW